MKKLYMGLAFVVVLVVGVIAMMWIGRPMNQQRTDDDGCLMPSGVSGSTAANFEARLTKRLGFLKGEINPEIYDPLELDARTVVTIEYAHCKIDRRVESGLISKREAKFLRDSQSMLAAGATADQLMELRKQFLEHEGDTPLRSLGGDLKPLIRHFDRSTDPDAVRVVVPDENREIIEEFFVADYVADRDWQTLLERKICPRLAPCISCEWNDAPTAVTLHLVGDVERFIVDNSYSYRCAEK